MSEVDELRAQVAELRARIDAYEGEMEEWEEVGRLIRLTSLGTPAAEAVRAHTPPGVGQAIVLGAQYLGERDDALDALEDMVTQHLGTEDGTVEHWNMAANEQACELLVRLRPERWRATNVGIERIDE